MFLEKPRSLKNTPFDKATKNLKIFAENFMILYSTHQVATAIENLEKAGDAESNAAISSMMKITLEELFNYVLARNDGQWD